MHKFSKRFIFVTHFILLSLCLFSQTTESSLSQRNQKIVRVGYYNDPGMQIGSSESERKNGYAYEFYQEIAKYTGWTYEYVYGGYHDIYEKLLSREVDIMAGLTKTEDRLDKMLFPDYSMGGEIYYIYVPESMENISTENPKILDGKKIGVKADTYMIFLLQNFAEKNNISCTPVYYHTLDERLEAYNRGDIDFLLTVQNDRMKSLKPVFNLGECDFYFAVSNNRPDLLSELNKAHKKIQDLEPYYTPYLMNKFFTKQIANTTLSTEEINALKKKSVIRFGYIENVMPLSGTDNGEITGISKYICEHLKEFLDLEIETIPYNGAATLEDALRAGEIDCAFPIYSEIWLSEQKGIHVTDAILNERVMVVYKSNHKDDTMNKIAVMRNSIGQENYVELFYPESERVYFDTRKEYFDAVDLGVVNCAIGCENILQFFMRQNPEYYDLNIAYLPQSEDFGIGVRPEDTLLLESLNKAIRKIDNASLVNALIEYSYIEKEFTFVDFFRHNSQYFAVALLAILLFAVLWFVRYKKRIELQNEKEKATQHALNEAYIVAKNASTAKSDFLSNMSHDIRTPMNAIIGMVAIADANLDNKEKIKDCLDKIRSSSNHLLGLVNNVLDMSKIEAGKMELVSEEFDIEKLMLDVFEITKPISDQKNITIHKPSFNGIWHKNVVGDRQRLSQVFINILSNAYKYTPENGIVKVEINEKSTSTPNVNCYEFSFADTGVGMSEDFVEQLFKPFTRNELDEHVTKTQGTGLGLAISKNIVQMMGGSIYVKSKPKEGSTFTVTLFLEESQNDSAAKNAASKTTNSQKSQNKTSENFSINEFKEHDFSDKSVLLVEDNDINAEIATEILQMTGMKIERATNGLEAIKKITESGYGHYDIIFMDIQMPVMNGYEATMAIRNMKSEYAKNIPIVAMTADAFADDIAHAKNVGINEHVSKPLKFDLLLDVLKRWLKKE